MEEKKCSKCGEVKELVEFNKSNRSKDGLNPQCKQCRNEYRRNYHKSHKPHTNGIQKIRILIYDRLRKASNSFNLVLEKTHREYTSCDDTTLLNWLQHSGERFDPNFDICNYDANIYHIDHIKPFSLIRHGLATIEEITHYTNLQILPADDNKLKGDEYCIHIVTELKEKYPKIFKELTR